MTMPSWLPLLLILAACPLMMIFMMRGMSSGHGAGPESPDAIRPMDGTDTRDPRDARLAELEREVAQLRAEAQAKQAPR